jgi:hypothetical protein
VIYVHNSGKITISRINFSVKSNVSANSQVTNSQRLQSAGLADSAQFTIDASQCTSIPAGQSCPIGFITPTVDSKHAQGSAVIQATFADSKNKIYTTSGVLNYSRVADKGQNGAVIHSGVSMTAAANATQAYGTVYVYGSGDGRVYNVNKLALDNPALKISQGDINGRQLQSHFVQAVELSSPVNSSQSVKSNSKLTTAAKSLNSVINGNLNAQSSDSQSGASYLSTVGVSAAPFSDGAILTTGIMPLIDVSTTTSGSFDVINSGNEDAILGATTAPAGTTITTNTCTNTLVSGTSCTVSFTINNRAGGSGNFTLAYDSASLAGQSLTQTVTWYNGVGAPLVSFTAANDPKHFNATVGGENLITIANIGGYDLNTVAITGYTATGSATASAGATAISCNDAHGSAVANDLLPVGGSCTFGVNVTDAVTETGDVSFVISGNYTDESGTKSYSRSAKFGYSSDAYAPNLTYNPNPVTITVVGDNIITATQEITVTNAGPAAATAISYALESAPAYLTESTTGTTCTNTLAASATCIYKIQLGPISLDHQESGVAKLNGTFSGGQVTNVTTSDNINWTAQANQQSVDLTNVTAAGATSGDGSSASKYIFDGSNTAAKSVTLTYTNTGTNPMKIRGVINTNSPIAWQINKANSTCYAGGVLPSPELAPATGACTIVFENMLAQNINANTSVGSSYTEDLMVPTIVFGDVQLPSQQYQVQPAAPAPISATTVSAIGYQATIANSVSITANKMTVTNALVNAVGYAPMTVTSKFEDYTTGDNTPSAGCTPTSANGIMSQSCVLSPVAGEAVESVVYTIDSDTYHGNAFTTLFANSAANQAASMSPLFSVNNVRKNKAIFVTSATHDGNFGGAAGADLFCNNDSNKPTSGYGANQTYKALLLNNNATVYGTDYYRTDGTTFIATGMDVNSTLSNSIGTTAGGAMTGAALNSCSNWTSTSGQVGLGIPNVTTLEWFNYHSTGNCSTQFNLYCVAQ